MKLGGRLGGLPSVDISPQNPVYRHKMAGLSPQNTQFATQFERTEPISQSDDWLVCHKRVTESLGDPVLHPVLHPVAPQQPFFCCAGVYLGIIFFFLRGRNKRHTLHGKNLGKKLLGLSVSWDGFILMYRMRCFMAFERAWNYLLKQSALEIRDRALSVLADMGLSWNENPLRPQHDQPVHADGRDISDDEYQELMQNDAFNEAVWDLTNIWALSEERKEQVMEYARRQMIGGF